MEEVKKLLIEAWFKAKANGVVIDAVNFEVHESVSDFRLGNVDIDAKLK